MGAHRFSHGWLLLIVGLIGVYAQIREDELPAELADWVIEHYERRTLDESVSAPNSTTDDSTADTDGLLFVTGTGSPENSNRRGSTPWNAQEYYDLQFEDGEEILRALSEATKTERAKYQEGLDRQMQAHQSTIPDQWTSFEDPSVVDVEERTQSQQEYAESAAAIKPNFASPGRSRIRWTPGEEKILLEEFKESIERGRVPPRKQILAGQRKHQILSKRTPIAIYLWLRQYIKTKHNQKTSPGRSRIRWTPGEEKILLEEFKESIERGRVPPRKQILAGQRKHQILSKRTPIAIYLWLRQYIKTKHNQKSRSCIRWTPEEEKILLEEFKESIERGRLPPGKQILAGQRKHQLLWKRTPEAITLWIRRYMKKKYIQKTSPGRFTIRWTPEEEKILLEEFKESMERGRVPPGKKILAGQRKHQLLWKRTPEAITLWIRRYMKKKHIQKSKALTISNFESVSSL